MTTGWIPITAGATGSTHLDGVSQDAYDARTIPSGPRTGWVIAAVADGHGGARYVRSGVGARAAVHAAIAVLQALPAGATVPEQVWQQIVLRWRETVRDDHRARPFTPAELVQLGDETDPLVAYGSTLIVALAGPENVQLWQLGDGDVLATDERGAAFSPAPPDPRHSAGRTTSLCSPDAATAVRCVVVRQPRWLMLATDGYGNAFADRDWRTLVGADLDQALREHGPRAVATRFPDWVRASAETGGDDACAVLLVNGPATADTIGGPVPAPTRIATEPHGPVAAVPVPTAPPVRQVPTAPPVRRGAARQWWWLVAGIAAGAATFAALRLTTSADPAPTVQVTTTVPGPTTTRQVIVTVPGPTITVTESVTETPTRAQTRLSATRTAPPAGDGTPPTAQTVSTSSSSSSEGTPP